VKSALAELRHIAMNLRPSTLDDLGIVATLAWYFREIEAACPNVNLELDVGVKESEVPEVLKIAIFRIVQEASSNALKHSGRTGSGCV
jgi:signal transduction histidine kinase